MKDQIFFSGLIRLHILHIAQEEPIYGLGFCNELNRFGYQLNPSTLYQVLHKLEVEGYLTSFKTRVNERNHRRYYQTTEKGQQALAEAKLMVRKLFKEVISK